MARKAETFTFNPTSVGTLSLLTAVHSGLGENATQTFQSLLSSALVAAAILEVEPEELAGMVAQLLPHAAQAIKDNPDIFNISYADDKPAVLQ